MITKVTIIILYFAVLFFIGVWSSRKVKDIKDYYVGGKKLGFWVVAFSTRATGESAWLLLGLTGLGAVAGVSGYWVVVGELIGVAVAWFVMARRFKGLSDKYGSITVPDYLVSRFRSTTHRLRILAALVLAVFVVIYVSAQIDATGSAFEAFLGWNYYTGALVGFSIVIAYILFGGFVAVAWSDLFQGLLMFVGLTALPLVALFFLREGEGVFTTLHAVDPGLTNIWGAGGLAGINVATMVGYACIGLGFMGSPQIFVRFMSIKDDSEILKGRWVAIFYTLLADLAAVSIGILARYFFVDSGVDPETVLGNNGQNSLILMVEEFLPLILIGTYIAIVLAAIMSTVDSLLVVASSAVVRDFYQQVRHPEIHLDKLVALSRKVTLVMALIALAVALTVAFTNPERTIFWFVIFGWSGIAASFCPVIILSLFWKRYTERAAIVTMIVGFLSVPFFKFVMPAVPGIGVYFIEIAELAPSFIMALLAGYVVSKVWPDRELEAAFVQDLESTNN